MLSPFHFAPGNLKDNVNYENLTEEKRIVFWELVRNLGLEHRIEADASSELSEGENKKCTRGKTVISIMHGDEKYHHLFDRVVALNQHVHP